MHGNTLLTIFTSPRSIPKDQEQAHINGMKSALQKVYPALKQGKISATQAVVEAVSDYIRI